MAHKGCECIWQKSLEPRARTLVYHWADRNNRMYMCRCMPSFRVGKRIKHPIENRWKRSAQQRAREINSGA